MERVRLLSTRLFAVEEVSVPTSGGGQLRRQFVVHPGAVVIVPRLDAERLVMIRNMRHAVGRRLLEFPAGTRETGEEAAVTASRELVEETGYRAGRIEPLTEFYTSPGICTELMSAFVAEDLEHVGQALEPGESIEVELVRIEDARKMLTDGELLDGKSIAALATFLARQ